MSDRLFFLSTRDLVELNIHRLIERTGESFFRHVWTTLLRLKDECCRFCRARLSIVSLFNCVQIVAASLIFVRSGRLNLTFLFN